MASRLKSQLISAAEEGNLERCQQLLSRGADVNGTDQVSREDVCVDLVFIKFETLIYSIMLIFVFIKHIYVVCICNECLHVRYVSMCVTLMDIYVGKCMFDC